MVPEVAPSWFPAGLAGISPRWGRGEILKQGRDAAGGNAGGTAEFPGLLKPAEGETTRAAGGVRAGS